MKPSLPTLHLMPQSASVSIAATSISATARADIPTKAKRFLSVLAGLFVLSTLPIPAADTPGSKDLPALKITAAKEGDDVYVAIEKVILALPLLKDMQKDLGKPILLKEVELKSSGNWAWYQAQPRTADKSWQGESLVYLMQCTEGKWSVCTSIPEEVITADDSEKAYQAWRNKLLKKYTDLPAALVPLN